MMGARNHNGSEIDAEWVSGRGCGELPFRGLETTAGIVGEVIHPSEATRVFLVCGATAGPKPAGRPTCRHKPHYATTVRILRRGAGSHGRNPSNVRPPRHLVTHRTVDGSKPVRRH